MASPTEYPSDNKQGVVFRTSCSNLIYFLSLCTSGVMCVCVSDCLVFPLQGETSACTLCVDITPRSIIIFIIYLFRFVWASPLSLSCFLINYCWSSPTSQIVLMVEIKQRQELNLTLFIFQAFSEHISGDQAARALYGRGLAKQRDALFVEAALCDKLLVLFSLHLYGDTTVSPYYLAHLGLLPFLC